MSVPNNEEALMEWLVKQAFKKVSFNIITKRGTPVTIGINELPTDKQDPSIIQMSAVKLAAKIRNGELSVLEVVQAHIDRIETVNQRLNAVIWPLFDQALEQAKLADELLSRGGDHPGLKPGGLFGVPITIKDQFDVQDTPTSMGLAHLSKAIVHSEGPLVKRLKSSGAIVLGKTNVPQFLMGMECHHGLYGQGKNPFDLSRAPGGSSGGEAAIIAACGSPLGLGGDMGGSIRVPAHCTGIAGLKPTSGRFANGDTPLLRNTMGDFLGFEGFIAQPGPMARTVNDLKMMMDGLLADPLECSLESPPVAWRCGDIQTLPRLRIGIYTDNAFFSPSPAIKRVVRSAGEFLSTLGHDLVPFEIPDSDQVINLIFELLCADGAHWIKQSLKKDKPVPTIKGLQSTGAMPGFVRKPLSGLLRMLGQSNAARMIRHCKSVNTKTYWRLTASRTHYRALFAQSMVDQKIDVLICPPYALPAPVLDSNASGVVTLAAMYTMLYNLLGMPAGTVPAGQVGVGEETDRPESKDAVFKAAKNIEKNSVGLPVGVQVVGKHWQEQTVLSVMKQLETHFKLQPDYPLFKTKL